MDKSFPSVYVMNKKYLNIIIINIIIGLSTIYITKSAVQLTT